MAGTIRIAILANAAKARAELQTVSGEARKLGPAMSAGAVAAGAALAGFGVNAVRAASDLNETLNKSQAIFGSNAAAMDQWAQGAARSVGLSRQAALEGAASFGDMFQQIGLGQQQAAKLSQSTIQLASDLGSFNNLDTADVMDRISAAYRGEYDSLQAVIPNINAARVEQEALALTHKKTAKELTAADKALAVNAILQKDGARAAGDFAKTSEGAANQQKILRAEFENLSAGVGQKLLPALNGALQALGALLQLAGNPAFQVAAVAVGVLAGAIWAVNAAAKAYRATQAALNIVMLANPVGLVILAIVALVAILVLAYKKSEAFRAIVQAVWSTIKSAWGAIPGFVGGVVGKALAFITSLPGKVKGAFSSAGDWLRDAGRRIIDGLVGGLNAGFQRVKDTLSRLTRMLPDWKGPKAVDERILRNSGRMVIGGFQSGLEDRYGAVQASLGRFTGRLPGAVDTSALPGLTGPSAAGASPTQVVVSFEATGDPVMDAIVKGLRATVRGGGGIVQAVLGR